MVDRSDVLGTVIGGILVAPLAAGLLLVGALQGCSVSPGQQEAIRQAWQEKDAERAAECRRAGRGFVAGGCTGGGGP